MKSIAKAIVKAEAKCCRKFERKGRACSSCPLMELLDKKERKALLSRALLSKARKKAGKAA